MDGTTAGPRDHVGVIRLLDGHLCPILIQLLISGSCTTGRYISDSILRHKIENSVQSDKHLCIRFITNTCFQWDRAADDADLLRNTILVILK
jgi:hypothetical protein